MAEEDEQRLFTEKVNRTFAECINLINEVKPYICVVVYSLQITFVNIVSNYVVNLF